MSDDTKASFAVELTDDVSSGALSAAQALVKLQDQLTADTKALADMQKAMRNLKSATTADVKAPLEALTKQIEAQKNTIASAQGKFVALGGKFGGAGKQASGFKQQIAELKQVTSALNAKAAEASTKTEAWRGHLTELQQATKLLPGPIGGLVSKASEYITKFDAAKLGTIALGAAFLATAAAAAVLTKSLFDEALAAGDARRNELLHFEALGKMRNMLGILPAKADEVQAAIDRVSGTVSISRDKVAGYAEQLVRGGVRGAAFGDALAAASIKASALGDAAGSSFAGFAASVALGGGSVKRLSDDVKNRFGGVVQRQMSSLAVQQLKQKENWASMFRGVNVAPVLDAMKRLRDILNVSTSSGQALKGILGGMLKPLFGAVETGLVFVRRFFKQMIIGALEMKVAYQEVRNWWARTFGKGTVEQTKGLLDRIQLGRVAVYMLAAAFAVLAVNVIAATWPFLLGAVAVWGLYESVTGLYDLWNEIDWTGLGSGIWNGIVKGLKDGWEAVKSVFSSLADEAANAFASALSIHSPSKVFAELGFQIPAGVAKGIELGAPQAQQAAANMVQAPGLGASTQGGAPPEAQSASPVSNNKRSNTITIGELHVHAATSEPKALAFAFRRELEAVLEGLSLEVGAPPLGAAP